ncbi:hypothetical protein ABPG72_011167 [Tetrahymena utriculariae]
MSKQKNENQIKLQRNIVILNNKKFWSLIKLVDNDTLPTSFLQPLYLYDDNQNISEIKLYRGAAIQKYQYDTMYQEFKVNQGQNNPTFIIFPQFLSTTDVEKVAIDIQKIRIDEVKVEVNRRQQILDEYSLINKEYLKSEEFQKAYKVLICIDAKFDSKNQFKPKSIKEISKYSEENEFLFQPFQSFRIDKMDEGSGDGAQLTMNLTYIL